jgi:monoamine oxidase
MTPHRRHRLTPPRAPKRGPGVLTGFGTALRAPHGAITFAGTETAEFWTGYMEGAVRSGQRAAQEAVADL